MSTKLHLIPGTMCNEKLWSTLIPYLDDSIELVYLTIPMNKGFDQLAAYYRNLLKSRDKINLIGFSLGGYIATYFSTRYPEYVDRLFVISNSPTCLPDAELKQRNIALDFVAKHGYKGLSRKKATSMLDPENQRDHFINLVLEMEREQGEADFISQYKNTSVREDLAESINRLSIPAYFYYSEHDPLINPTWMQELSSNWQLSVISTTGSGHMLPLEKPEELAHHINDWLSQSFKIGTSNNERT